MKLLRIIWAIFSWAILACFMMIHLIVAGIGMWFFKDKAWGNMKLSIPFINFGFFLTGIRVKVTGLENIPRDRHFVLMSNHQSLVDVLILLKVLPVRFSFIAKKQLQWVPILGWDMRLQGHFFIDRSNPRLASHQLQKIKLTVQKGRSLLFFPEGTRSPDGRLLPFKRGGFIIAQETGTPILPVCIKGANKIIKKKSFLVTPGTIHIAFGGLIKVSQSNPETEAGKRYSLELMELTSQKIQDLQNKLSEL